jgi:hypothetical protein
MANARNSDFIFILGSNAERLLWVSSSPSSF